MAVAAAAMFATSASVAVVALAFALYAGVEPYLGRAGAAGVVAGTAALFLLVLAMLLASAGRAPRRRAKPPTSAEGFLDRALDFVREKPIVAVAAAIGVGVLAMRNPQYFGAAVRAFVDSRNPPAR